MIIGLAIFALAILVSSYSIAVLSGDERIVSFPFLFSLVHLLYVFPSIVGLYASDYTWSAYYRFEGVTTDMMAMSACCYLAAMYGYSKSALYGGRIDLSRISINLKALDYLSLMIGFTALLAVFMLARMQGGVASLFVEASFYDMQLSGPVVWLLFLARFVYVALACSLVALSYRPTFFRYGVTLILLIYPILNVALLYRRSDLVFLAFMFCFSVVVIRRKRIGRLALLTSCAAVFLAVSVFPALRLDLFNKQGFTSVKNDGDYLTASVESKFDPIIGSEILSSAARFQRVSNGAPLSGFSFVPNSFVKQFVPSSIVGKDLKDWLLLGSANNYEKNAPAGPYQRFDYGYLAPMGFVESYEALSWAGGSIFFVIGFFAGRTTNRVRRSPQGLLFYMVVMPYLLLAATNDINSMPARIFTVWALSRLYGLITIRRALAKYPLGL
ncbi:hypothetical protein R0135_03725 [Congregibacter variabilis]|uniref:DEP domain-containing protein n=1 Tax=Congregibacter variabilis TaxID=3081200 RepID=A0ABZ0I6T4_9GAMM|nr:hypothetical protein R0135_03725 [Congregibacter sp. IMCC43200]